MPVGDYVGLSTAASTQITFPSVTNTGIDGSLFTFIESADTTGTAFDSATIIPGTVKIPNKLDEELDTYLCGLSRQEIVELIGAIREINEKLNPIFLKMAEDPAFAYSFTLLKDLQKRNFVIIDKATGVLEKLLRCALTA